MTTSDERRTTDDDGRRMATDGDGRWTTTTRDGEVEAAETMVRDEDNERRRK